MTTYDELVTEAQARAEFGGVTAMTFWRWDRDPRMLEMGWPPVIKIGKRNFRSRKDIERFKAAVQQDATKRRAVV